MIIILQISELVISNDDVLVWVYYQMNVFHAQQNAALTTLEEKEKVLM
jgi:hypothetical protein